MPDIAVEGTEFREMITVAGDCPIIALRVDGMYHAATLTDLCDLIESGSEAEKIRLGELVSDTIFLKSMTLGGVSIRQAVEANSVFEPLQSELAEIMRMKLEPEDHECER